jgi:putative DNA primase/helicase
MNQAFDILRRYAAEFIQLAEEVGIDGAALLEQLPAPGHLLTGYRVPVIHPKYRCVCSVILHVNQTKKGQYWPLVKFHSFKHGGDSRVFNGLKMARDMLPTHVPLKRSSTVAFNPVNPKLDDTWRMQTFLKLSKLYFQSPPLGIDCGWLKARLCGQASVGLMARTFVHQVNSNTLLAPLTHPSQGVVGYHKISVKPDGDEKRHYIHASGLLKGSYIEIQPQKDIQHTTAALCEGLATGLTIALVWPGPVYIALTANNLAAVRNSLKGEVAIFCDNDVWKPATGNVGKAAATKALKPGDSLFCPEFTAASCEYKPTDFNDLLMLEGIAVLTQQIGRRGESPWVYITNHNRLAAPDKKSCNGR